MMWMQVRGLFGARGILPAGEFLAAAREQLGSAAYWRVPTLFWLGSGDGALAALCAAGTVLAALLVIGVAPLPLLAALWAMYLSIVSIGQDFLSFQWDSLLLEAGFLAIFFAPLRLALRRARHDPPSAAIRWLILWLLFRLMFSSGMVKLLSGDPTWRDLTAMSYHYETQPIPAWTSWYVHQFPPACHKAEVLVTFFLELIVPFMIFGPRVVRRAAFVLLGGLQMLIMATGNFGFFNLLTMALAVPLLDDAVFSRWWRGSDDASKLESNPGRARWALTGGSIALGMLSLVPFSSSLGLLELVPRPMVRAYVHTRPLGLSSPYGLFAVMTTRRPELIIEGSNDGTRWLAYEFKYKPGDVKRRPPLIGPHMPRLDWQMWFAALGGVRANPVARRVPGAVEGSVARRHRPARAQPLPRRTAARTSRPRGGLPLHRPRDAPSHRRVVAHDPLTRR